MSLPPFVDFLVRQRVLRFGDFVTKSGRPTPYFANFGDVRTGAAIGELGRFYAEAVVAAFGDVDIVFGPAYKGIPLAVATAQALADVHGRDVGFCFDRKEVKDHGEGGSLVGQLPCDGDRVVIVEDVTTAGTSVRQTVPALRAVADVDVVGLVVGLDRQERGPAGDAAALQQLAAEFGLQAVALTSISEVVDVLRGRELDGQVLVDDVAAGRIAAHLEAYGAR